MESDVYDVLLNKLKDTNLIKYFDASEVFPAADRAQVLALAKKPTKIFIENNNLCYKNDEGDTVCCPHVDSKVSDSGYWLSDKIVPPPFDVSQGGNVRKAEEAESCYICCVVASILNDEYFETEIRELVKTYNFDRMASDSEGETFTSLLLSWQDLQSVIINVIVSAAKYSISNQKKDSEQFLRNGLTSQEQDALRDLALSIKSINFKYSTEDLSPKNVKTKTKIEILKAIDERDAIINKKITQSQYGVLYKTLNLSTEYISAVVKKRIRQFCIEEVDKMFAENPALSSIYGEKSVVCSKLRKRASRLARNSVRREQVEKYIKDSENFVLPRKG